MYELVHFQQSENECALISWKASILLVAHVYTTSCSSQMLLHKIGETEDSTASRRLAAKKAPDTKGFIGLSVKQDKSMVSLGAKADVKLIRSGPSELSVSAAKTNFFGSVAVNGKPLGGVYMCTKNCANRYLLPGTPRIPPPTHTPRSFLQPNSQSPAPTSRLHQSQAREATLTQR